MSDCIFCRIAAGEISADIVHQDDLAVALRDLNPQAPTHILVIPRRHVSSVAELGEGDEQMLLRLLSVATSLAREEGLDQGYRLVTNVGPDAGQTVHHLHLHLLGGRRMGWPPG
ncbi:MAG TPA: histidine triad nucleotide-binding protein [Candidatus Sulfotelmatobacter sp.]|jgi:histidine triad (HIT) family protein|nr:histidine triad nucleotide-binding protein [Candidatus Sulfotelmatobacter sp.]